MKKNESGITLIKLMIIIVIMFFMTIIIAINYNNVSEIVKITYKSMTNKIDIEQQIEENEKLIGTTDVTGPGIIINVLDGKDLIHQEDLVIIIDELKNAGSQAISINEQRITSNTYLYCDGTVILIDGIKIGNPFVIKAIGETETIYGALTRNKGYLETLKNDGLEINVEKSDNVQIAKTNKTSLLESIEKENGISKLNTTNKIAGKTTINGKGIRIIIQENSAKLTALSFLQIINDLNSADAKAIAINGERVTSMTDLMDISSKYVLINSIPIDSPFIIDVIGDQDKIEQAIDYNNSYITKIIDKGNNVYIKRLNNLIIQKYEQKKDQNKMLVNYLSN